MATEAKPKRLRLPIVESRPEPPRNGQSENGGPDQKRPAPPPKAPKPPSAPPVQTGPSWAQFIGLQVTLLAAISIVFGILAIGFFAKATTTTETVAPVAVASTAPVATVAATPAATATPAPAPVTAARLPQPKVAPPVGSRATQTVKVALEARELDGLLADGIGYTYWTFGGTVPGPMIRVRQGDTVELTLSNAAGNTTAHSINLQAVNGPGGGGDVTMVAPGQSKTFKFQALTAGVFVYSSGSEPLPQQVSSGMYGLIVVEPPQGLPTVDHEYYVMQGEVYLEGKSDTFGPRTYSAEKALAGAPDYVVFNGSVDALTGANALRAKTGETVRLFFGVAGPSQGSRLQITGTIFSRVATEGTPLSDPTRWATNVQGASVPVNGAAIIELRSDVPGRYSLTDSGLSHAQKGATGYLIIDGAENPGVFSPQH